MHCRVLLLLTPLALSACASLKPADFAGQQPTFDPLAFFTGRTESNGVMENRRGTPVKRVRTSTSGVWHGSVLHVEQDLFFDNDPPTHRSWRLRRTGPHTFAATANDIVGTARGEAHGPVFHWAFTLAVSPGNPLANVRMSQWMYLQPDGRSMVNHTTITKAGVVLRQVTEQFQQLSDRSSAGRPDRTRRQPGPTPQPRR